MLRAEGLQNDPERKGIILVELLKGPIVHFAIKL